MSAKNSYSDRGHRTAQFDPFSATQHSRRERLFVPQSGPLRRLRRWAMVAFTWPIEWPPGKVLSRLRDAENAHDQLDQVTEPERLADKACISLDVGAHARLRYGAHNDAGDVAVRLGCPHRVEQPCTIKHRHHE